MGYDLVSVGLAYTEDRVFGGDTCLVTGTLHQHHAAIYVAGVTESLAEGVRWADAAIASGEARNRLDRLVVLTQSFE
jgi:anthranilate phosphoribosyltransferase